MTVVVDRFVAYCHRLIFRRLAIPWLQAELDVWVSWFNTTRRRASRKKTLPQGVPAMIAENPGHYGHQDLKVSAR